MFIADFHIHSKYARATSKDCVPEFLELWGRRKGLSLIGTGDFTHPVWREELKEKLVPAEEGLYRLKKEFCKKEKIAEAGFSPRFIISGEISSIYKKNGKVRKVHNVILLPGLDQAEALSRRLEVIGNLHSDGRPILGLDSRDLLEITLDVCPDAIFIPAHIWTPHFSLFGAYSGFDDIRECFEDLTDHIYALETGLSSDPPMNWRLSALDKYTLVSNSDAHSPGNLAREANLFDTVLSYPHIARALQNRNSNEFYGTIEFFPEEGKYHYDGHRNCKVCLKPLETEAASGICPVCGDRITVGVLHRVEELADREEGFILPKARPFENLVPLHEVIAASTGLTAASVKVKEKYSYLIQNLGPELFILREAQLADIENKAGPLVAEGIRRLRCGKVDIEPGYDGKYGKIKILDKNEISQLFGQMSFYVEKKVKSESLPDSSKMPEGQIHRTSSEQEASHRVNTTDTLQKTGGDIRYGLNKEQWEAVSASDRAIAVIAGPGTGKTKTLVNRIAYLVEACGVQPSQITAVTFTNKAAGEMRERLEKHFGSKRAVKDMTIGTFHSICLQSLSRQNGGKDVTLIDEVNALSIVEEILKSLHLKNSPRDVLRGISWIKSGAQPAEGSVKVPPEVYDLYCAELERYGVLDYDDILLKVLEQFEEREDMGEEGFWDSFSHLLVDEFQDINDIQYRLIKEWGKNSKSIFIIGDPDQSIYGFRGSDPRYFEKFYKEFHKVREISLTRNYRSTPEILCCAKAVISLKAAGSHARFLETNRGKGVQTRLLKADDAFSEAVFVAKEINNMVGGIDMLDAHTPRKKAGSDNPRGFSDIAVLYRVNRQAEVLEQCLQKEGIPYTVAGRNEFLSDREVQKAVAFFRLLLNPEDRISLMMYLRTLDGFPSGLMQEILETYDGAEKSVPSLAAILKASRPQPVSDILQKFAELLCRYEIMLPKEKPQRLLESWISDNGQEGVRSMELLSNTAVLHSKMESFLQDLVLGRESDLVRSGGRVYSPDAVSLITMHGSKGLEFPVVFLCGLNEGTIPFKNHAGDCDTQEERRLFYVGMTRAKDELVMLTSSSPSPFLDDIPERSYMAGDAFEGRKAPDTYQFTLFDYLQTDG